MTTEDFYENETMKFKANRFGVRHFQAGLIFVCVIISGTLSISFNVALLAMTNKNSTSGETIYDWDKSIHGYIQSSFFWGDLIVQLIACSTVHVYGGKFFISIGMIVTGIIALTMPTLAQWADWIGICLGVSLQSLSTGLITPAVHTLIGKWAPPNERSRIGNFIYAGYYVSSIIAFPIYATVGESYWGWPWIFYLNGLQSILCGMVWLIYGSNSPAEYKNINQEEREYIEKSLEQTDCSTINKTPWRKICTSIPIFALMVAQAGSLWCYTILFFEMTSYYNLGLGIELQNSGLITSAGYTLALILVFISSWTSDEIINRNFCSITTARKIFNTIGTWGPALCLLLLIFIPNDYPEVKVYITVITIGLDAINSCGYWVNHIDLSPNYAGVLVAAGTFVSDLISQLAPVFCGFILTDPDDQSQWNIIFISTALIYFISNLVFILLGKAEKQSWDSEYIVKTEENTEMMLIENCAKNDPQ